MKRGFAFVLSFLFLISFCYAIPQITIQKSDYRPSETVLGTISGVDSGLSRDSLKIFEGRREVSFEKDITLIEGNYYFYIIPPKIGSYDLKINNVLYRENSVLKSLDLGESFNVSQKLDANNKTYGLTIRPGFYVGDNPILTITNNGQNDLNLSLSGNKTSLKAGESRKISPRGKGLFMFDIESYEKFSIPIFNLANQNNNLTTFENSSDWNASLAVPINLSLSLLKNTDQNFSITLRNFGGFTSIKFKTNLDFVKLTSYDFKIDQDQTKNFVLNFNTTDVVGAYTGKIEYYINDTKINETRLDLYIFPNLTNLDAFQKAMENSSINPQTCDDMRMFSCEDNQNCPTASFNYDYVTKKKCCSVQCVSVGSGTDSTGILIGILALFVVGGAGYYLYTRMKKFKGIKPEEQFKKVAVQYDKTNQGK